MIYPTNLEQKIDFPVIREILQKNCASSLGRELVTQMSFCSDYELVNAMLHETDEMCRVRSEASLSFPAGEINDVREFVSRIRVDGLFMDENELFHLRKTLEYAALLEHFFLHLDEERFPILSSIVPISAQLTNIVAAIDRVLDNYGQLRDSASPELAKIRHEMVLAQGAVSRAIMSVLRRAQADGMLDKDVSPTIREGRLVLPIPPAIKRKIGGIVHDESATGKTIFVEPQEVVEANNKIRTLQAEENRERLRILIELASSIRPSIPDIMSVQSFLAHVDFLTAKALFAQEINAIAPEFLPQPIINWRGARHAVLFLRLRQEKKEIVPLDICLEEESRILIISGPNAGGKSVCLKTVALLQYMLQCGLLIPVDESSKVGIFDKILLDIGDEQSINDDLSTYSSHLRNMKKFLHFANERSLFLIDEFGSGTEPLIGGAIAESVLVSLNKTMSKGVITTHYTNLKHLAERTPGIVNGAMLYDRGAMRPLFQLCVGQAGSSFAIEIAQKIGLPNHIIQYATSLVGEQHIDYEKQLQDIARDRRYWENKRQNIRQKEKYLDEKIATYEQEIADAKKKRKEILEEANLKAADLLRQSNATIERTIREIKESKAEKERTQKARKKVDLLKKEIEKHTSAATKSVEQEKKNTILHDFGDLKKLTKNTAKLTKEVESPLTRRLSPVTMSVVSEVRRKKLSFNRELDIRGLRADEALEQLIAYMDDSIMVAAEQVTILHGTGTGALKQLTHDYLTSLNKSRKKASLSSIIFHEGDPDRGGAGLTIVEL